jgi:proteic killer suppression protein
MPVASFRHKGLQRFYENDDARGVPPDLAKKIHRLLTTLNAAAEVAEMRLYPGWRLHPLKGELEGFWSVTVSGNWRIIFRFEAGEAFDVDLIDYH